MSFMYRLRPHTPISVSPWGQITFNPLAARVGHLLHRCDFYLKYGCEAQVIHSGCHKVDDRDRWPQGRVGDCTAGLTIVSSQPTGCRCIFRRPNKAVSVKRLRVQCAPKLWQRRLGRFYLYEGTEGIIHRRKYGTMQSVQH